MRLIRILSRRRKFFLHFYILLHNNIVIYKCSKLVKLYHLKNAHSSTKNPARLWRDGGRLECVIR